jgi:flagella basal body P-ring formation protein FlgA
MPPMLLAVVAAAIVGSAATAADIVLRSAANVHTTVVRLGDVAEIRGTNQQDAQRLAALPLMPAPAPGTGRFLSLREVEDLLAAHGEDLVRLNFQGEPAVEIVAGSSSAELSDRRAAWLGRSSAAGAHLLGDEHASRVREQLQRLIVEHLERTSGRKAEWRVKFSVAAADLAAIASAKSEVRCAGGRAPWTGKQRFVVSFATARSEMHLTVFAEVTGVEPVVVAIRPIEAGQMLTAADVELQQWETAAATMGRRAPLDSVEAVLGTEATRTIPAGEAVLSDSIRPPLLVKRGEEITVMARGGGIQVRTLARARQNGARGELISVESLQSRAPFEAVVVGFREAVVFSGSGPPAAAEDELTERPFRKLWQR